MLRDSVMTQSQNITGNILGQMSKILILREKLIKKGWALTLVNKKFSKHMEYRDDQMIKFKLKWQKVVLDLIQIGKLWSIKSFISLENRENEIPVSRREAIFKVIFKSESVRAMKLVMSKKLKANKEYQMNLLRMSVSVEEDPDYGLYKFAYEAHLNRNKNLKLFLEKKKKLAMKKSRNVKKVSSQFIKILLRNESEAEKKERMTTEDKLKVILRHIKSLNRFKLKLSDYFMYALVLKVYGIENTI